MKVLNKFLILLIVLGATCGIVYKENIVQSCDKLLNYTASIYGNKSVDIKRGNNKVQTQADKAGNKSNLNKSLSNAPSSSTQSDKQIDVNDNIGKDNSQTQLKDQLEVYDYTVNTYDEYYNVIKNSLENFKDSVSIKINNYNSSTYNLTTINKILDDYYDIDYGVQGASGTIYSSGNIYVIKIQFKYKLPRTQMLDMKNKTEIKAREIISKIINPKMNDLEKETAIHDYIVNNTSYDYDNYIKGTLPEQSFTDYGVLVLGKAVCEGYSKAMFRLLNMAGVQCYVVKGTANGESHAWNIVKINGNYTEVDATFDDPVTTNGKKILSYRYFDLSDEQMARDHQWDLNKYPKSNTTAYNR